MSDNKIIIPGPKPPVFITEKPSVAQQFKHALRVKAGEKKNGYIEGYSEVLERDIIITWAVGHLVTLSYPEAYDEKLKKWNLDDLPFLPDKYKYEVISEVRDQFAIVKKLLNTLVPDSTCVNCGDSGREGEYIQRLITAASGVKGKINVIRVWIDSQTDAEIIRGVKYAKPESEYDNLAAAAYMRAIEDYAMGINFSRALSCKYGQKFNSEIQSPKWKTISVGRVMTCVLGMVVDREREIKNFKETPFYKINADCGAFTASWKAIEGSRYFESPLLYNDTGFLKQEDADALLAEFDAAPNLRITNLERKTEKKQAPLLFNLAELQAECSRIYKISPDETLDIAQKLYEAKLTTYPRTDARVLTIAVANVIERNLKGLESNIGYHGTFIQDILDKGSHKGIGNTRYTDDSKVTDHYAIIPTGEGDMSKLSELEISVYYKIIDRFLSIFMPAAIYAKTNVTLTHANKEQFFASSSELKEPGYLEVAGIPDSKDKDLIPEKMTIGDTLRAEFAVKEGKTQPPKRYTSGSMILAMENAGNLIEEEELREQIKGCGIGTSATRASTIKKLVDIGYLKLNQKTQVITPHPDGEAVYDIVKEVLPDFLSPKMTANWERGLSQIEQGKITRDDYNKKLNQYISVRMEEIKALNNGQNFEGKPFEKKRVGKCPVCGADVMNSRSGNYVCSMYKKDDPDSCKFGIPRYFFQKMLNDKQMDALMAGNKTELIQGFKNKEGKTFSAFLYIEEGKVKLEFPTAETDPGLGKCPSCGKKVLVGKYGAYCSGKCGMMFSKAMGKKLTESQIKKLLAGKPIVLRKIKSKDKEKEFDAQLTPTGIENFVYTNKNGETVNGKQFKFKLAFPKKKKKAESSEGDD